MKCLRKITIILHSYISYNTLEKRELNRILIVGKFSRGISRPQPKVDHYHSSSIVPILNPVSAVFLFYFQNRKFKKINVHGNTVLEI